MSSVDSNKNPTYSVEICKINSELVAFFKVECGETDSFEKILLIFFPSYFSEKQFEKANRFRLYGKSKEYLEEIVAKVVSGLDKIGWKKVTPKQGKSKKVFL